MSELQLTIKAPFISAAEESYLQTLLPGYESKEECDECIELYKKNYTRRTVSRRDLQNAVLMDELVSRVMPNSEAIAKAEAIAAKQATTAAVKNIAVSINKLVNNSWYCPPALNTPAKIERVCEASVRLSA